MKKIPVELKNFKKVDACEGKTREWMANHYLKSERNGRLDVLVLLQRHVGYQSFVVGDESWEPLYNAFKNQNYVQITAIARGTPVKPRDTSLNLVKNHPIQGQKMERDKTTSIDVAEIPWKNLSPFIPKKTDFTAKLGFTVYAVGYKDKKNDDKWSKRFMGFKKNNQKDVIGGQRSLAVVTKFVIEVNKLVGNTGLLTALPHDKESADATSPLYKSASAISKFWNIEFLSTSLTKKKHRPLRRLGYLQRKEEIAGSYTCSSLEKIENIIILDDFVTSGLTFQEIERSIRATNHNVNIFGAVLGIHPNKFESSMNEKIFPAFEKLWPQ